MHISLISFPFHSSSLFSSPLFRTRLSVPHRFSVCIRSSHSPSTFFSLFHVALYPSFLLPLYVPSSHIPCSPISVSSCVFLSLISQFNNVPLMILPQLHTSLPLFPYPSYSFLLVPLPPSRRFFLTHFPSPSLLFYPPPIFLLPPYCSTLPQFNTSPSFLSIPLSFSILFSPPFPTFLLSLRSFLSMFHVFSCSLDVLLAL